MKSFYLLLIVLVAGCNQLQIQKENIFIFPPYGSQSTSLDTSGKIIPPPPTPGYTYLLPFNIIVDSTGQLYYYQRSYFNNSNDLDWDTIPVFTELQPKDIILLPEKGIDDFIKQNIELVNPRVTRVSIASLKDTVRSDGLVKVLKVLNDTANHATWVFREASQEEKVVLDYKNRDAYYDADDIKWDSTKTRFRPIAISGIYVPPKINKP